VSSRRADVASIDKRPNGRYRARYREFAGGPQKTKTFDRKADADRWLTEMQHRLYSGTYVDPSEGRTTLRAWCELYVARQPWRANTTSTANASLEHVLKVLGDRPLSTIRKGDLQDVLAGIDRAPSTVRLARQHIGAALQAAVDDDVIVRNPVLGVKVAALTAGEVVPPTVEVVKALYEAAPDWFAPAILLGAGLGLRQAEASGLTADRVDWLGEQTVRVDRQWMTKRKPYAFGPPKGTASIRTIPAAQVVLDMLGQDIDGSAGHVLHRAGEPVDHNRFGYHWRATLKAADVEPMRFHFLRHHFASALISAGCSVKAVQKALGHAKATTTLDTYAHLWPGDEDRIRQAIQAAFAPAEDSLRTEALGD